MDYIIHKIVIIEVYFIYSINNKPVCVYREAAAVSDQLLLKVPEDGFLFWPR